MQLINLEKGICMPNNITANLFTNAAFTRAFRASLANPKQKVVYNGFSWKVGTKEFKISQDKVHAIRTCFLKIGHRLRMQCSYNYCKTYKRCVRQFENAQFRDWPESVAKSAKVANLDMLRHEYLLKQLPMNIETNIKSIAIKQLEIQREKQKQQNDNLETPEVKKLNAEIKLLGDLEGNLNEYIAQRIEIIRKENDAVGNFVNRAGTFVSGIFNIPQAVEANVNRLPPDLIELASQILDPIPLNPTNNQDATQFKDVIARKIKELTNRVAEIIIQVDAKKLVKLEEELKALQAQLVRFRGEQTQVPQIITKFAQNYDDTKLLPSPPQSPYKAASSKVNRQQTGAAATHMQKFLTALERNSSPQMRSVWEALLLNLSSKYGDNMITGFDDKGKTLEITFKHHLRLYMLPCDDNGNEAPQNEPVGGSVLMFGDEANKKITIKTTGKNSLNITGLSTWARIPKDIIAKIRKIPFGWGETVLKTVGEYTRADLPSMRIRDNQFIITAYKKVDLKVYVHEERPERTTPVAALKKHWREHGELPLLAPKQTMEDFLRAKRAELIRKGLINPD